MDMAPRASDELVPVRRGFTLIELLIAMALLTFAMSVLSLAFVEGLETFRQLKAIGDLAEELRADALTLRGDVLAANRSAEDFIADTLRTGSPDPESADALRADYEAICADALDLESRLRAVERRTVNPIARRLLRGILGDLNGVKAGAARFVRLLDSLE
jgi:prepilin-type N-terminal cleavage/methylation domain-containing protein